MNINPTSHLGDKPVRRIGLGVMQLAGSGVFGPPRDPNGARAVLRRAAELGVDHIDTAQYYGPDVFNDCVEDNLRSLATERMDLVNLRVMDEETDTAVPLPE